MTIRRTAAAIVVAGFVIALWGLAVSLVEVPTPGVVLDAGGDAVVSVYPGSPAWRDGVRQGQRVVALTPEDGSGSWAIRTSDDDLVHDSSLSAHLAELRGSSMFAVAAIVLAVLGLLYLRLPGLAAAFGAMAIVGGSIPIVLQAHPFASTVGGLVAPVAIGGYLAIMPGRRSSRLVGIGILGLGVAWLLSRLIVSPTFDAIEVGRYVLPGLAAFILGAHNANWLGAREALRKDGSPTRVDVLLFSIAFVAIAVLFSIGAPPAVVIGAAAAGIYSYPKGRGLVVGLVDRIVFAEVRERSEIAAIETERQRLASDIHDAPLQEIAAVIKRLERYPEAGAEVDALVDIAGGLRRLSSDLRPPALDDLGLGPALRDLASQGGAPTILVELDDKTGFVRESRLPLDVEVAAYRIVIEAARNATRHAEANRITVNGTIGPDRVELVVADDGSGIDRSKLRAAARAGHFGIATMRQRASMVGGVLELSGVETGGTSVIFRWPA